MSVNARNAELRSLTYLQCIFPVVVYAFSVQYFENSTIVAYGSLRVNGESPVSKIDTFL